jgi:hypothetical protein
MVKRTRVVMGGIAVSLILVGATLMGHGCGTGVRGGGAVTVHETAVVGGGSDASVTGTEPSEPWAGPDSSAEADEGDEGWGPPDDDVRAAFADVAARIGAMSVYAPEELPAGTELASCWWPLTTGRQPDPTADSGENNPRVIGSGESAEARILLRLPDGWVEILEAVRGDLGDLPSEEAGEVGGHAARSYRLMDGYVVQWSDEGRWYAVFGLGVAQPDVKRIAHALEVAGT